MWRAGRLVGVCWLGPSGAIDPGWPYIRDRKPELHASSRSLRSPLSSPPQCHLLLTQRTVDLGSLLSCGPRLHKLMSIHHLQLRLAAPKCTQPSIHSHSFITLQVNVCACALVAPCVNMHTLAYIRHNLSCLSA